uniref:Helitron helicase-like domain-containing protein n=1 Tax=Chenopodium quinoa TaxID=63459 RepID=A0A803LSZ5_CHEQI
MMQLRRSTHQYHDVTREVKQFPNEINMNESSPNDWMQLRRSTHQYHDVTREVEQFPNEININEVTHQCRRTDGFDRRWEFGPRTVVCPDCKALMWIEERVKSSNKTHPRFNHCCQSGQVILPLLPLTPPFLMSLLPHQQFRNNIRAFNSMLAFTSMGGRIDNTVNDGRGPYVYRISGSNYHRIGTLLPEPGTGPKFAQLYIYDTDNETSNRLHHMGGAEASSIDPGILQGLKMMLDDINPYVTVFRNVGNMLRDQGEHQDLRIKLICAREGRQYIQPTTSEVAALMRGLPHAHILITLEPEDKPKCSEDIDVIISAEIPDKDIDPLAFETITKNMLHGPCGPCLVDGKCSKNFPKKFCTEISFDDNGFVHYRRRQHREPIIVNGREVDNRWVVPYNRDLCVKYNAHINVERVAVRSVVKYLYKYVTKGQDRATVVIENNSTTRHGQEVRKGNRVDEIKQYLDCRYVSAIEACWRIFEFDLQHQYPSMELLQFHLPGEQFVVFNDNDDLHRVLERPRLQQTMLTMWFQANKDFPEANQYTYQNFPMGFTWNRSTKRSACHASGLLDDDNEWHETLSEASNWASGSQLRNMFCSILMFSEVSDPKQLWEQHWGELTDDLERMMQRQTRNPNLRLTPEEMQNQGLQEIEHILNKLGRSLTDFPDMPQPSSELARNALNRLIRDELEYDTHDEANRFDTLVKGLNTDQYRVYAAILDAHSRDGDEVQITLFNADIDKYKEILKQGKVYSIAQLDLMPLYTSYKYSNNQMRLKFGNKTMITEILDDCDDIPRYNFMFIEFCHIPQYLHMRNSPLIDVIGLVIYVSESYRVSGGRQQFKRDVLLCNTNMETMRLTLREGFAYDQGRFLFNELNQDHVLGASMVSVGSYYGACFSTVGRTRLFIDPDIDETDDLHGWYADDGYVQKQIS